MSLAIKLMSKFRDLPLRMAPMTVVLSMTKSTRAPLGTKVSKAMRHARASRTEMWIFASSGNHLPPMETTLLLGKWSTHPQPWRLASENTVNLLGSCLGSMGSWLCNSEIHWDHRDNVHSQTCAWLSLFNWPLFSAYDERTWRCSRTWLFCSGDKASKDQKTKDGLCKSECPVAYLGDIFCETLFQLELDLSKHVFWSLVFVCCHKLGSSEIKRFSNTLVDFFERFVELHSEFLWHSYKLCLVMEICWDPPTMLSIYDSEWFVPLVIPTARRIMHWETIWATPTLYLGML